MTKTLTSITFKNPNSEIPPRLGIPDLSGSGYISELSLPLPAFTSASTFLLKSQTAPILISQINRRNIETTNTPGDTYIPSDIQEISMD